MSAIFILDPLFLCCIRPHLHTVLLHAPPTQHLTGCCFVLFCWCCCCRPLSRIISLPRTPLSSKPSKRPTRPLNQWDSSKRSHDPDIRLFSNRGQRNRQTGRLYIFKRPGSGQNLVYAQLWLDLTKLCLSKALAPNCSTWRRSIVPSSPVFFFSSPPSVLLFFLFAQPDGV